MIALRCMPEQALGTGTNPGGELEPYAVRRALRAGRSCLAGFELSQTLHCLTFCTNPRLAEGAILQMYPGIRIDLIIRRIFFLVCTCSEKLFDLAAI
jgi:hypothetical protein